ncbi:hypothetical protein N566_16875 [Streptomycetaceae bacterium MP113-05]|nr:hypothetical protein N566_16875 [Streptomycetaceae bacterium MP113-05]
MEDLRTLAAAAKEKQPATHDDDTVADGGAPCGMRITMRTTRGGGARAGQLLLANHDSKR